MFSSNWSKLITDPAPKAVEIDEIIVNKLKWELSIWIRLSPLFDLYVAFYNLCVGEISFVWHYDQFVGQCLCTHLVKDDC